MGIFVGEGRKRGFLGLSFLFSGVYGDKDRICCDTDSFSRPYSRAFFYWDWIFKTVYRVDFECLMLSWKDGT